MFTAGVSLPGRLPHVAFEYESFDEAMADIEDHFIIDWDTAIDEADEYMDEDGVHAIHTSYMDAFHELRLLSNKTYDFDYIFGGMVYFIHANNE